MENSKLACLLKKLDGYQWRSLSTFVESPFHNTNEEVISLFRYLHLAWQEGFSEKALIRETAYAELFPNQPYHYQHLNQLMSNLLKLAEKWLALQQLENAQPLLEILKAEELLKLGLDKHYRQAGRTATEALNNYPIHSEQYYYSYKLKSLEELHFVKQNQRRANPALQQASDSLDDFYALNKLRYSCEMLNRQRLFWPQTYHFPMMDALIAHLRSQDLRQKVLLQLYFQLFLLLSEEQETHQNFDRYVAIFDEYRQKISKEEARALLYYAINFCIGKVRYGERAYAEKLFGLYQRGLNEKILLESDSLSPWTYKNMVKLGLNLKKYDWVEWFVRHFAPYLPQKERKDAMHYNLAELYFFQGRHEAALGELREVEFTDIHYNLGGKALLAKIYYEAKQWEALESLLASFLVFLRRNKAVSQKVKEPYTNFVRLLSTIIRSLPERYGDLAQKIKEVKVINNRDWLLQQLE